MMLCSVANATYIDKSWRQRYLVVEPTRQRIARRQHVSHVRDESKDVIVSIRAEIAH